jgi:hypothetical protein
MEDYSFIWWLLAIFLFVVWRWTRKLEQDVNNMHKEIAGVMQKIVFMRIETHADVIYAYNAMNEEFVCQGKTMDDLNVQFGLRFPDRKGIIVQPDDKENVA